MLTDPSKQAKQILELPPGQTNDKLKILLNDRIRDLTSALGVFVQNPALGDVDLGTNRGTNCADPKNDLDIVNLRTLKKFSGSGVAEQVSGGSGIEQPTIYLAFDGLPFDGQASPYAIIMANRAGFTPTKVGVSAVGAPSSAACEVNLLIVGRGNLLSVNLSLPIGSIGPVFTSAIALPAGFPESTLIQGIIVVAGNASQVTISLSLRGKT
mgnify:CR=1 FL=1